MVRRNDDSIAKQVPQCGHCKATEEDDDPTIHGTGTWRQKCRQIAFKYSGRKMDAAARDRTVHTDYQWCTL